MNQAQAQPVEMTASGLPLADVKAASGAARDQLKTALEGIGLDVEGENVYVFAGYARLVPGEPLVDIQVSDAGNLRLRASIAEAMMQFLLPLCCSHEAPRIIKALEALRGVQNAHGDAPPLQ